MDITIRKTFGLFTLPESMLQSNRLNDDQSNDYNDNRILKQT